MWLRYPPRTLLQMIIADHPRRIQRLIDITRLQQTIHGPCPYAREAIGLQLQAHRQGIRLLLVGLLAQLFDLRQDGELILHVMGHLMRDHISRCKISSRAQLLRQGLEKICFEIGLLIRRAVERPRRATGATTR